MKPVEIKLDATATELKEIVDEEADQQSSKKIEEVVDSLSRHISELKVEFSKKEVNSIYTKALNPIKEEKPVASSTKTSSIKTITELIREFNSKKSTKPITALTRKFNSKKDEIKYMAVKDGKIVQGKANLTPNPPDNIKLIDIRREEEGR